MTLSITIRDVPEATRDELAARAARSGRSLQEFLRMTLEQIASKPEAQTVIARMRQRKQAAGSKVPPKKILAHRDADRR